MMRAFVALLLFTATVLSTLEAAELLDTSAAGSEQISQDENVNSHPQRSHISRTLKESSHNSQKASDDSSSSSGNFGSSLWGVFLYILIALSIFVAALIFLLRNVLGKNSTASKVPSQENLINSPANRSNPPKAYGQPPPTTSLDNPAMRYNNSSPAYPPQQYKPDTSFQSYSGQEAYAPPGSQDNYFPSSSSYNNGPSSPMAPVTPLPPYNSPPPTTPVAAQFYSQNKSAESDYYTKRQEEHPFEYLDKYQPYTSQEQFETAEQTNMNDMSTKRAVLRDSTPYQVIEERVQGEDYDDTDTFVTFPNTLNPAPNPKPKLSSNGSFNDGKNRLVRVLPRFHQNQQQHMGGGSNGVPTSSAVFQPVAPPPPPPQSQIYPRF